MGIDLINEKIRKDMGGTELPISFASREDGKPQSAKRDKNKSRFI
jgi:hypothetical protein